MKEFLQTMLDPDFYIQLIAFLGPFGFIAGIAITMLEAFFPPLPLALFVTVNVITFGFLQGYFLSYMGTVIGSYCVFLILRRLDHKYISRYIEHHPKAKSLLGWMHEKGVLPLFVLLTFPFTPSIIVCSLAALADIKKRQYLLALVLGKFFMVLSLSFIGVNISSFIEHPLQSSVFILGTLCISIIAKVIINTYEKRVLRKKEMHIRKIR